MKEFSSSFDSCDIEPILHLISQKITTGFSDVEIIKVIDSTKMLKVDEEIDLDFEISYSKKLGKLNLKIVMDDVDAPDVYFFSDLSDLIDEIGKSVNEYMERQGR